MDLDEPICCPFCGFIATSDYQIMLHLETKHPEDNTISPFAIQGEDSDTASLAAILALSDHAPSPMEDETSESYAECPVEGCGEALLFTELESHIEMHAEEQSIAHDEASDTDSNEGGRGKRVKLDHEIGVGAAFDTKLSYALRNLEPLDDPTRVEETQTEHVREGNQAHAKATWKGLLKMPETGMGTTKTSSSSPSKGKRRLGKAELGPYANEKHMPSWLVKLLQRDGEMKTINQLDIDGNVRRVQVCDNMATGIVSVITQLLEQDPYTQYVYMCSPSVRHVSKLKREGGFCGYRNIQMLCSYILDAESQGHEFLNGKIPTIFDIQENIEHAWDQGIHAHGRLETGGIRNTRKYIGTPDAQAMFLSLGIACDAQGYKSRKAEGKIAYELLFQAVEAYFNNGCTDYNPKVRLTSLPPIYFQHPGHSMTIVGIEKQTDGSKNLLVFDPMFHDAVNVLKLVGETFKHKHPGDVLKAYRRGAKYLKRYHEFELLNLTPPRYPIVGVDSAGA